MPAAKQTVASARRKLTHLERLEAESIHLMREVVSETERPVMLYSIGKDSAVMLHLAKKAFYPSRPPFPLMHVDTTWEFREMYALRDKAARDAGMELLVYQNPEALAKGINPFEHGPTHIDMWKTEGLKQALDFHGFDAAFGIARRDEDKGRARERVFSFRSAHHHLDPKRQRPQLGNLYNARMGKGESLRVFPLSSWTELDIWRYIYREGIEIVPLYLAALRPTVKRDGLLLMVDDERFRFRPGEEPVMRSVRFCTLGCYPLTGAVESQARTLPEVLREMTESLVAEDIDAYLEAHQHSTLLRFITCGSVDDGKSTLIGCLLCDSKRIPEDQLPALEALSEPIGTQGQNIALSLPLDGLAAEREQGITIDVAYRLFTTEKRKFIVADAPGHEQHTRNMLTGASTADLAVILIDARKGVLTQTKRHSYLVHLIGIRHIVLAVNKMDLVGYEQEVFEAIIGDYAVFASSIGMGEFTAMPISGLKGDNITGPSPNMPWYAGPALLPHLETVQLDTTAMQDRPLRMAVQRVHRSSLDFRGVSGLISSGKLKPGDAIRVLPSGRMSNIARILAMGGDLAEAVAGQSVTLTFADEVDCSRGDVIAAASDPLQVADQFQVTIVWMDETEMLPGRPYWMKIGTQTVSATVHPPKYQISVNTMEHLAARTLELNAIGVANIATDQAIPFESYAENRDGGGFILIDKTTNATVAVGMIHFALRRADNVHRQALEITREYHAETKQQKPVVLWLTGLSGAGKSTIANLVEKKLASISRHTFLLDGDNIRHGLNKDLGFTDADRVENIRRVGEVAKLMTDAGLIVITAFISPFRAERQMVRQMMRPDEFFEVFVDTPLEHAEARDVKGLYRKARTGQLKNFTGIDSPYEPPEAPDLRIDTTRLSADQAADAIVAMVFR